MNDKDRMEKLEKKVKMLEGEVDAMYKENIRLREITKAIQELQEMHEAPASKLTYYLG